MTKLMEYPTGYKKKTKTTCTMRTAKQWDKLGSAVVPSAPLEVFKAQLHKAPGSLSDPVAEPALSRRLD